MGVLVYPEGITVVYLGALQMPVKPSVTKMA